jgi:hypothetical protein
MALRPEGSGFVQDCPEFVATAGPLFQLGWPMR